jgi:hypothetical protein
MSLQTSRHRANSSQPIHGPQVVVEIQVLCPAASRVASLYQPGEAAVVMIKERVVEKKRVRRLYNKDYAQEFRD